LALCLPAAACGNSTTAPSTNAVEHLVRVEPTNRFSFGPGTSVPAGTTFYFHFITLGSGERGLVLSLCGPGCATASTVQRWEPSTYKAGDTISRRVDGPGEYYAWIATDTAASIVSDNPVGSRLRMGFATGSVLEGWYVLP
jgi:hypothetical protein